MTLGLTMPERLNRALADIRMGVPVMLTHDGDGALVVAVEAMEAARLAAMLAQGPSVLALTDWRAATLKAQVYDGDLVRIGIAPTATLAWLRALADPKDDLQSPMKGPFHVLRDGSANLHRAAIALCKAAHLLPAAVVTPVANAQQSAQAHDLTTLSAETVASALARAPVLHPVVAARLPMAASSVGKLHVFRTEDGGEEHYAIEIGKPDREKPVLARLHSACFTGDVLGSLKCDCGPQLHAALAQMGAEGAGVLLYLNQEGRGIGLANKMRAYSLQDQGFDTVDANHRLGFADDERDFRIGAGLLRRMGFGAVRLMTNNPAKIAMLQTCGLSVTERVPLHVGETPQNRAYLATKAAKSGHLP